MSSYLPAVDRDNPKERSNFTWRFPVAVYLATRVSLLLISGLGLALVPELFNKMTPPSTGWLALDGFCRWDCEHYAWIAVHGYDRADLTNFWPLLPALTWLIHSLTSLPEPIALLLLANIACVASYMMVYRVFSIFTAERTARLGLLCFALFPFSYFHSTGYPESMMVLFSACAVWLGSRQKYWLAALSIALGVLAKHVTILMGLTLVATQIRDRGIGRHFWANRAVLALFMPLLAVAIYAGACWAMYGDPLSFYHARANWGSLAWLSLPRALITQPEQMLWWLFGASSLVPAFGLLWLARDRRNAELVAAGVPLLITFWSVGVWGLGRYSASLWPGFLGVAMWLERYPQLVAPVIGSSAMLQGFLFYLWSHQFAIL